MYSAVPPAKRSDWRILVCDDNRAHRRMVKSLVMDMSIGQVMESPVMFGNAEPVCRFAPHLIIGRLIQADKGIIELMKWLRNPELTPLPGVHILVSVGVANPQLLTMAVKAGADLLVAEPLTLGALQKRVESLMTAPLPRIRTATYYGPDRRRTPRTAYGGVDRRSSTGPSGKRSSAA